jgi:hypothetical protein
MNPLLIPFAWLTGIVCGYVLCAFRYYSLHKHLEALTSPQLIKFKKVIEHILAERHETAPEAGAKDE